MLVSGSFWDPPIKRMLAELQNSSVQTWIMYSTTWVPNFNSLWCSVTSKSLLRDLVSVKTPFWEKQLLRFGFWNFILESTIFIQNAFYFYISVLFFKSSSSVWLSDLLLLCWWLVLTLVHPDSIPSVEFFHAVESRCYP